MSPALSIVDDGDLKRLTPATESVAQRVRRLQAEARTLAREHIRALTAALAEVEKIAGEIADGGDPYPVGVRNEARLAAEDAGQRAERILAILGRANP